MSIFKNVKENITVRQAAEAYGFRPDKIGLIKCIFHPDKDPSMKVDSRYYCFGCGCTGDVIDFTAQLFGLDPKAAALKLADDFCLTDGDGQNDQMKDSESKPNLEKDGPQDEAWHRKLEFYKDILLFHRRVLRHYEDYYAPKEEDEEVDDRFYLALKQRPVVEHQLDVLFFGTEDEQKELIKDLERGVKK